MVPANVDEEMTGDAAAVAERNARRKATATASQLGRSSPASPSGLLVLGADTVVVLDGDILGKPADEEAARAYLRRLNGRTHEVVGAIALAEAGEVVATAVETTRVTFHRRSDDEIDAYVATGEWVGRAGGYAIQETGGPVLVDHVDGDYLNVVGLPLARLEQLLATR